MPALDAEGLTVLAHADHGPRFVAHWGADADYGADLIYWDRPAGGTGRSVGRMTWAYPPGPTGPGPPGTPGAPGPGAPGGAVRRPADGPGPAARDGMPWRGGGPGRGGGPWRGGGPSRGG